MLALMNFVSILSFEHCHSNLSIPIKDQGLEKGRVIINDNVWVGAKSIILSNVVVDSGVIVGAGAVVKRNCTVNGIYAGVPAKLVKERKQNELCICP